MMKRLHGAGTRLLGPALVLVVLFAGCDPATKPVAEEPPPPPGAADVPGVTFDEADGFYHISPEDAYRAIKGEQFDIFVLNVCLREDFDIWHVEGSERIALEQLKYIIEASRVMPDKVEETVPETDRIVLVHCKKGKRSLKAARLMRELGYTEVINLDGGMTAWGEAKLPYERSGEYAR